MNIHTYEKAWLAVAMVLIVGFIATITYGAVGPGIAMIDDDGGTIDPDKINDDERFSDPGVTHVGGNEYEASIVAQAWSYTPGEITVPADSKVTFYVTSRDVTHSYTVVGTNVNTMVVPGQVSQMTAEFNETGEYGVLCNEYCVQYHHTMEGKINVVPEDEFDLTELSTDAPDEAQVGNQTTINATVSNGMNYDLEPTTTLEIGDQTIEQDVTVPAHGSETVEFAVDTTDLGTGDNDWTVTVDGHEDGDTLTVTNATEGGDGDA